MIICSHIVKPEFKAYITPTKHSIIPISLTVELIIQKNFMTFGTILKVRFDFTSKEFPKCITAKVKPIAN